MRWRMIPLVTLAIAAPAAAADLTITKTATVVSDTLGNLIPRSMPGSVIDYRITATNPIGNLLASVGGVQIVDQLPANVVLRVSDLAGTGRGPVEFQDGALLGLLASGMTCPFVSLASTSDCIEFSTNGTTWTYVPVPDAQGYDANVRAIRVRPGSTFTPTGTFQIRFRVKIR